MDTTAIIAIFRGKKPHMGKPSLTMVSELQRHVSVSVMMDKNTLDYYYSVSIDDISKSDLGEDELKGLVEDGWSLDKEEKSLIKFLTA